MNVEKMWPPAGCTCQVKRGTIRGTSAREWLEVNDKCPVHGRKR